MNICNRFPKEKKCPICKKSTKGKAVLIPIDDTGDNPGAKYQNYECEVIHLDCLNYLRYSKSMGIIYQRL